MNSAKADPSKHKRDWIGEPDTGRFGGDVGRALAHWAVEGVLYMLVMGAGYGVLVGFLSRKALNVASKRSVVILILLFRASTDKNADDGSTRRVSSCIPLLLG
jgi:hypothetical protein